MNIYNVTVPMGKSSMTVITIAANMFDAQMKVTIRTRKKKKIIEKKVFGIKNVKVVIAPEKDIIRWIGMLEQINDKEQLEQCKRIIEKRAS